MLLWFLMEDAAGAGMGCLCGQGRNLDKKNKKNVVLKTRIESRSLAASYKRDSFATGLDWRSSSFSTSFSSLIIIIII